MSKTKAQIQKDIDSFLSDYFLSLNGKERELIRELYKGVKILEVLNQAC